MKRYMSIVAGMILAVVSLGFAEDQVEIWQACARQARVIDMQNKKQVEQLRSATAKEGMKGCYKYIFPNVSGDIVCADPVGPPSDSDWDICQSTVLKLDLARAGLASPGSTQVDALDEGPSVNRAVTKPKKKRAFLKKVGGFIAFQPLGIDLPAAQEQPDISTVTVSRPSSELALQKTPMSDDAMMRFMANGSMEGAMLEYSLERARLPKSASDWASLETACAQGPHPFYRWIWGTEPMKQTIKETTSWKSYGPFVKNPIDFCRIQVDEYERGLKQLNATKVGDSQEEKYRVAFWRLRWQELDANALRAKVSPQSQYRWPKTDAEQLELNRLAKSDLKTCWPWIGVPASQNDNALWQRYVSPDTVRGCNEAAMHLKYKR